MIAAAYAHAEGERKPAILTLADYLERYGSVALYGMQPIPARTLLEITAAQNVIRAYQARAKAENWAEWAKSNPEAHKLLITAAQVLNGEYS